MAGEDNLLGTLAALVAGFDDASWEALTSKGLLRRARKDIEKGLEIVVVEDGPENLKLSVAPFVVSMTASGPAGAKCTCSAPGVCQHILAAGLYLQSRYAGSGEQKVNATENSIRDEIALLTTERLKSWAGSADYKKGLALFAGNMLPSLIEYAETVVVRLMPSGTEIRFVPGGGFDGMILPKSQGKRAGVAAILALRKHLGFEIPTTAAQQSLVDVSGTPRTKKEILDSACSVLEDAIAVGLSHVSEVLSDRLVSLAVSAQGAQMPRVSLSLKTVSDEVKSNLQRAARADEARLLLVMATVYALMDGIRAGSDSHSFELAGATRGLYVEVPEIELSGVGAYTWQTGSGYVGLTVLFWSNPTKEFLSWSYARPEIQRVDARQRFYGEGPWEGAQSPQQVAAANLKLRNARRTARGRLSSSTKTSALVLSPVAPQLLEFGDKLFTSWEVLRRYVSYNQPLGLREPNPLDLIVVLRPAAFGERTFDSITQTFTWEIYDELDQALMLTLAFRDWTRESIRMLEQVSPPQGDSWRFVVKLTHQDDRLLVEPISILRAENTHSPVFHLAFVSIPQKSGAPIITLQAGGPENVSVRTADANESVLGDEEFETEEIENPDIADADINLPASFHGVITEFNSRLEAIAETGMKNGLASHRDWFARSGKEVHSFGLTALANMFDSLSKQLSPPGLILKARYLTHVHSQATAHLR